MATFGRVFDRRRWRYLMRGFAALWTPRGCPCCGEGASVRVDRKFVYSLHECAGCGILYRHPSESAVAMHEFYQGEYEQRGLTTDHPSPEALAELMRDDFAGSPKDTSRVCEILRALGLGSGASVLDYGANWGYASYQLRKAGFAAEAFEVSKPRAAFGRKLGIEVHTDLAELPGPFDAVYASHVLEHVPNPRETLRDLLGRVRPGGFVLAHTPNGCAARRARGFAGFHQHWGQVHPVLLTDRFLEANFPGHPVYVASDADVGALRRWDRRHSFSGPLDGSELFFAIRAADTAA